MKTQVLILALMGLTTQLLGQRCPSLYDPGVRYINDAKNGSICFFRETEKLSEDRFYTRYTIKAEGGREVYNLEFFFFKDLNKITVKYAGPFGKTVPDVDIPISQNGSKYLFKDYKADDPNIRKQEIYTILFGIAKPEIPYIVLYHMQLPDSEEVVFWMKEVEDERILLHKAMVSANLQNKTTQPPPPVKSNLQKEEIKNYKDSVLSAIENNDQQLLGRLWLPKAEGDVQRRFTAQLNDVFYQNLKNIFPYEDNKCQVEVNLRCNDEGKNLSVKNIRFINSLPVKWLADSIRSLIAPKLRQLAVEPMTLALKNENLVSEYDKRFNSRVLQLNKNDPDQFKLYNYALEIKDELAALSTRIKPLATEIDYELKYQSVLKYEVWVYKQKSKKSDEVLFIENSTELVNPSLRKLFFDKITTEKRKSKYKIKRCEITINNETTTIDIVANY